MFVSARAKIGRAREHFNFLKGDFQRFINSHPYATRQEFKPDTGKTFLVYYPTAALPTSWSLVVGELLYNLRSALDHVVYDLGTGVSMSEFPIFNEKRLFFEPKRNGKTPTNRSGLYKIRGITNKRARRLIEEMQPYHVRQGTALLWVLHELNNIDKHRTLHLCRRQHRLANIVFSPGLQASGAELHVPWVLEDRAEIASWVGAPVPENEVKPYFTLHIAFDEGEVSCVVGWPVEDICRKLLREVVRVVRALEKVVG